MTDDVAVDLYQLSLTPQFAAIPNLLQRIAGEYQAPFPRKDEEKVAYETSNWVSNVMRLIMLKMYEEIEVGKRLSSQPDAGGEPHADEDGHQRRRA
jgi:hypothetical protein